MKMDVGMVRQPPIVFGFVRAQVVDNHMDDLRGIIASDQFIHKVQELAPSASLAVMVQRDLAREDIESGKESRGPVSLIVVAETAQGLSVGQSQVSLGPLQGL